MPYFKATIQHNEKTFEQLAHMQYDLFCKRNRYTRTLLSMVLVVVGLANSETWWGFPLIGYAWYLISSTYASSNHTARKLSRRIKEAGLDFPSSRYEFGDEGMTVITLPENKPLGKPLLYGDFRRLGEDGDYFYIFRDEHGGYMIPKSELGSKEDEFRSFIEKKAGQRFRSKVAPVVKLIRKITDRKKEPYHL